VLRAGLHLSVRELLATLGSVEETVLLYHDGGKGRPRARRMLTDMSPTQQRLAELFDVQRYAPTRWARFRGGTWIIHSAG